LQREHNEDSFALYSEFDLYLVADGMGGHRAGGVASKMATEAIGSFFRASAGEDVTWPFHFDPSRSIDENRLITGIKVANRQIYEASVRSPEHHGMGTTVVGVLHSRSKGKVLVGHVGDSRCYRLRGGEMQALTRDHSLLNDYLLAMPDLPEDQREELPRNVITRALGMQDTVAVDVRVEDPEAGDLYLLCSDGLTTMVPEPEILEILKAATDLDESSEKLVAAANAHGGEDNVTAVLVRFEADG
jgi:protein phosphatase